MADPLLFQAPDFQQIPASQLVAGSPAFDELHQTIADLQAQVADLTTRVAALESAAAP
jgi:hypothetical protein